MVIYMNCCIRTVYFVPVFLIVCFFSISFAGNKDMVDERIQEMDDLNKQMVKQIPGLPRDGKVDAKARVSSESGKINFEVYQVESVAKEATLDFGGENKKPENDAAPKPGELKKEKTVPDVSK
jgi:hypothetical protein